MRKAIALLMLLAMAAHAKPKEIQVAWSQLDRELARSKVAIATVDAKVIEGEYAGMQGDELRVTTKTGEVRVARASIEDLRRMEPARSRGRIIGTLAGVAGGLLLGLVLAFALVDDDTDSESKAFAIWLGTAGGLGTAGYFIGREFDKRSTRIVILP